MMLSNKHIYLIRHAKSSWRHPELSDVARPLNKRGKRDAPYMAEMLRERGASIQYFLSSPARRARDTAYHFLTAFDRPESDLHVDRGLYHADEDEILEIIQSLPDEVDRVALFGHNPGYTYLANAFARTAIHNVPTCGIVEIVSTTASWAGFEPSNAELIAFHYPKQFFTR